LPAFVDVEIEGRRFRMFAERGLYCIEQQTLFVADTHLGKDATFRRHGIAVPEGGTKGTLNRVDSLLRATDAKRLVILGDMFHARSSLSPSVTDAVGAFFESHRHVRVNLVRGNHDAKLGELPRAWLIEEIDAGTLIGTLTVGHHPVEVPSPGDLLLCGHVHPGLKVSSHAEKLGTFSCFWLTHRRMIFPAIGKFTGRSIIKPAPNDRLWIVEDEAIFEYRCLANHR
jgi:DNA ligase-associated metallophosphoesterase